MTMDAMLPLCLPEDIKAVRDRVTSYTGRD